MKTLVYINGILTQVYYTKDFKNFNKIDIIKILEQYDIDVNRAYVALQAIFEHNGELFLGFFAYRDPDDKDTDDGIPNFYRGKQYLLLKTTDGENFEKCWSNQWRTWSQQSEMIRMEEFPVKIHRFEDYSFIVDESGDELANGKVYVTKDFKIWEECILPLPENKKFQIRKTLMNKTEIIFEFIYLARGNNADGMIDNYYGSNNYLYITTNNFIEFELYNHTWEGFIENNYNNKEEGGFITTDTKIPNRIIKLYGKCACGCDTKAYNYYYWNSEENCWKVLYCDNSSHETGEDIKIIGKKEKEVIGTYDEVTPIWNSKIGKWYIVAGYDEFTSEEKKKCDIAWYMENEKIREIDFNGPIWYPAYPIYYGTNTYFVNERENIAVWNEDLTEAYMIVENGFLPLKSSYDIAFIDGKLIKLDLTISEYKGAHIYDLSKWLDSGMKINEEEKILNGINIKKTSVAKIKEQISELMEIDKEKIIQITSVSGKILDDNEKIGTGTKVKIREENTEKEYTILLYGDVNGDGEANAIDSLAIVQNKFTKETNKEGGFKFSSDLFEEAGRIITKDKNTPGALDALAIVQQVFGISKIKQYK